MGKQELRKAMVTVVELEDLPVEGDPINTAAYPLIEYIFAVTASNTPERASAVGVVLQAIDRVRAALNRPKLN
jgi:hypothetical protein